LLGIARRKAGAETRCPHCGSTITVPKDDDNYDQTHVDDLTDLFNGEANPHVIHDLAAVTTRPAPPTVPRAAETPRREPRGISEEEQPLFERDLDSVLGMPVAEATETTKKSTVTAGLDVMSLEPDQNHLVISSQTATAIIVAMVVLLGLAFAAGFLIASR
jgi:hypothetical protein